MAYDLIGAEYADKYIYQADEESDVADLPTTVGIGSTCIVLSTGNIYLLSSDREWLLFGGGGGGGGGTTNAVLYVPQTLTEAQKLQARANIGSVGISALPVSKTATINVADWDTTTKKATCSIPGLRVDSDTTQSVRCLFVDNAAHKASKPWFSCAAAGTLTVECQGSVPTAAVTVQVIMQEV